MLTFAAIVPHSPILLPSVGKEHLARLKKTTDALAALEAAFLASKPEAIIVISPHGPVSQDHFTLDFNDRYACNLREFGVLDRTLPCHADTALASALKEHAEDAGVPLQLRTEEGLDYGVIVPLSYLTPKLGSFAVLPIYPSHLPLKDHYAFGQAIQEAVTRSNTRVAVLASAELSHRLTETAPGGYDPEAKRFDEKIVQLLGAKNASGLLNLDEAVVKSAGECGLTTLVTYLGVLDKIETRPEILSYEAPFGVGTLVTRHHLS